MSAIRQQPTARKPRALLSSATAADRECRRLERDLHDGVQQRLVALSLQLRLLAGRLMLEPIPTDRQQLEGSFK